MRVSLRAYSSKLVWSDRSFSDCIAIVMAYRTWKRHHSQGLFTRPSTSRRNQEQEWCFSRFLQAKVSMAILLQLFRTALALLESAFAPLIMHANNFFDVENFFLTPNFWYFRASVTWTSR